MYERLTNLRFWLLVFPAGWLTMVFVLIAFWPDPGAESPEALASEVTNALRTHDFRKLQPLLAVGGEDVAKSTVEHFATATVDGGQYRDGVVVVEYTRSGTHGVFRMPVEELDERYVVNAVITPTG